MKYVAKFSVNTGYNK